MNSVNIIGNIIRDVELAYAQSGTAIAKIGVAVNKRVKNQQGGYVDKPVFIDMTAFGKTAETLNQYFRKGSKIGIDGELNFEQWQDQQGQKRSKLSVIINRLHFIDKKDDNQQGGGQQQQQAYQPQGQQQQSYNQPQGQQNAQAPQNQQVANQQAQPQYNQFAQGQQSYQQPQQNQQQQQYQAPQNQQQPAYNQQRQGPNTQQQRQPNQNGPQQGQLPQNNGQHPQQQINEDEIPF